MSLNCTQANSKPTCLKISCTSQSCLRSKFQLWICYSSRSWNLDIMSFLSWKFEFCLQESDNLHLNMLCDLETDSVLGDLCLCCEDQTFQTLQQMRKLSLWALIKFILFLWSFKLTSLIFRKYLCGTQSQFFTASNCPLRQDQFCRKMQWQSKIMQKTTQTLSFRKLFYCCM